MMANRTTTKLRAAGIAALATSAVALAGCGGGSSSSSSAAAAAPAAASSSSSTTSASSSATSASAVTVGTTKGSAGTYLTGAGGRALYLWVPDKNGKSVCSGACASAWPPLIATGAPKASSGVDASKLGTTTRSDGTKQVTYAGHPLYYFIADKSAGQTTGQGNNSFGAPWWLVAPSGQAITK
jgi:predicted lipoprotein with Yx(FWY)xxD motif